MKSRNIIFPRRAEVEVREEEIAGPGSGEVLCRAALSLVSLGTEGHCLRGIYDLGTYWEEYIRYPFHPGYSMAARVIAVGDGVTSHRIGDRVTSWAPHSEYFLTPENQLFAIPDAIRDEEAIWATLARTTQLAVRRAELTLGESTAVVGLGLLGQLVTQYLRLSGARDVIAIDMSRKRLDLAAANGATKALCLPADQARQAVANITGGRMVDVVFDVTGHPAVLAPASLLLRKLGRLVLLGDSPTPSRQSLGPRNRRQLDRNPRHSRHDVSGRRDAVQPMDRRSDDVAVLRLRCHGPDEHDIADHAHRLAAGCGRGVQCHRRRPGDSLGRGVRLVEAALERLLARLNRSAGREFEPRSRVSARSCWWHGQVRSPMDLARFSPGPKGFSLTGAGCVSRISPMHHIGLRRPASRSPRHRRNRTVSI